MKEKNYYDELFDCAKDLFYDYADLDDGTNSYEKTADIFATHEDSYEALHGLGF